MRGLTGRTGLSVSVMEISSIIGSFIEAKRREAGISQSELAKKSKVSRATLIKLEAEGSNLTMNNAYKLFEVLSTTFSEFDSYLQQNFLKSKLETSSISTEDKNLLKALL